MKKAPDYLRWTSVCCIVMFLFNACKKIDTKPCCSGRPPEAQWQLTRVQTEQHSGPGVSTGLLHRFRYNAYNLPVVHEQITDLLDPEALPTRVDSFIYNNCYQLVRIISDNIGEPGSYKKTFTYDASSRKTYSLKYLLDNSHQYHLADSTVYRYQGNTIRKITYHFIKPGTDTAVFIYNSQQNLVSAKLGEYATGTAELQSYDTTVNPAIHFNSVLELDPYSRFEWDTEFLLMMQSPKFSRNNYLLRQDNGMQYDYSLYVNPTNGTVEWINAYPASGEGDLHQVFEYTAAN